VRGRRRLWWCVVAAGLALVSSGILVGGAAGSRVSAEIGRSALAPYSAFRARRAARLCDDFTRGARADLTEEAGGRDCSAAVRAFVAGSRVLAIPVIRARQQLWVTHVEVDGTDAKAVLVYGSRGAKFRVTLRREGGSWRVATKPHLTRTPGCVIAGPCTGGTTTVLFWLGLPVVSHRLGPS
jgi:hypothetical protein